MLRNSNLSGFGTNSIVKPETTHVENTGFSSASGSGTTVTIPSVSFGSVRERTHIMAMIFNNGTTATPISVTIAGVAATKIRSDINTTTNQSIDLWYVTPSPAGTSGTVVITYAAAEGVDHAIEMYSFYNLRSGLVSSVGASGNVVSLSASVTSAQYKAGDVMVVGTCHNSPNSLVHSSNTCNLPTTGYQPRGTLYFLDANSIVDIDGVTSTITASSFNTAVSQKVMSVSYWR